MTFPPHPFQPTPSRGGSDPARRTSDAASEPAFSGAASGDLPQWQKDWEEEEDRQLAAKFLQAVNRVTQQGIEAAVRSRVCGGCGHQIHSANTCSAIPLFTGEDKCGCWEDA